MDYLIELSVILGLMNTNDILSVIENPDWKEEKEEKVWHAFKRSQNKVLRVVVKGKKEPYTVITMFYDKRLRSKK